MKKRIYWLAAMAGLCLLASCTSEEEMQPSGDNQGLTHITFHAGQSVTRTIIDGEDSTQIDWQEGECISILDGSSTPRTFTLTSGKGEMEGTFDGMAKETNVYTAVYPQQQEGLTLNGNSVEGMVLPDVQTANAGTFDPKANLMMARTKSGEYDLQFYNATAFIKVTPQMDCEQISIVNADSAQALAGTMTVTLDESNTISTKITANGTHMVSLMGDIKAGSTYYIAVAPGTLAKGFRLGITTSEGKHYRKDASKSVTLTANKVLNLGSISIDKMEWLPYVTFSAKEEQGVTLQESDTMKVKGSQVIEKMWYSTDYGKHWSDFKINQEYSFGKEKRLMLMGANNTYGTSAVNVKDGYNYFIFKNGTSTSCSGDIRSLVNGDKVKEANTTNVRFYGLFNNCYYLTSAPELPALELAENCYEYMFHFCYMLKEAPDLPATTLKNNCYGYMFTGCMSLEKAPVLLAEKLVSHCYCGMFGSCYQLKNVTMLAKDVSATNCLELWLKDAANKGTVYVASDISDENLNTIKNNSNGWNIVRQQ